MRSVIGSALVALSLTAPVLAVPIVETTQFRGESASASFFQQDTCNYVSVFVQAFNEISRFQSESPIISPLFRKQAEINYSKFNYCTGEFFSGSGIVQDPYFNVRTGLQSAVLNASIRVFDEARNEKIAQVNLNWTGTGKIYRGNNRSFFQEPGFVSLSRSNGAWRDAVVSGSVVIDGINLIENVPLINASLSKSNSGSRTVTKR